MSEDYFENLAKELNYPPGLTIRYTAASDADYLQKWLSDPSMFDRFPMEGAAEIDDATKRWISFHTIYSSITAEFNKEPVAIATLYIQAYKKLTHQCEFGIIVDPKSQNKGFGTFVLKSLLQFAKDKFNIELLHLQVNGINPAIHLYERLGFTTFAKQTHWLKEKNRYVARIFMERIL